MTKRRMLLTGTGVALLLVAGVAVSHSGVEDDVWGFDAYSHPMTRLGGPVETTLRIVPPLHDAIWPPLPPMSIFC
jgi:hypothetical protein